MVINAELDKESHWTDNLNNILKCFTALKIFKAHKTYLKLIYLKYLNFLFNLVNIFLDK